MDKCLEELRDELAEQYDQLQGKAVTFKAGWNALLKVLSEAAGKMDDSLAIIAAIEYNGPHDTKQRHFVEGARWMHSQISARVGKLDLALEHQRKVDLTLREEIATLEARPSEVDKLERIWFDKFSASEAAYKEECANTDRCRNALLAAEARVKELERNHSSAENEATSWRVKYEESEQVRQEDYAHYSTVVGKLGVAELKIKELEAERDKMIELHALLQSKLEAMIEKQGKAIT